MLRRKFLLAGAAAAGAACVPQAARAQFTNQYQRQLTIGVNAPLSGDSSGLGREIANGVQAAIDETNRFGGTFGNAFVMRPFDDMDALAQSIVNVQFAAADDSLLGVVGSFDGSLIAASLSAYDNSQMPLIVPGSTADVITERGYRNVWRLPTKDSMEGQLAARFIAKRWKPKLAIAVTQDGDYGPDVAQGFYDASKPSGLTADVYAFPKANADYALAAKRLLARNLDAVYLCGEPATMGPLIPALRAAGYKGSFAASQGFYNQATLTHYAADFESGIVSTPFPPLELAPDVANALSDFRARYTVTSLSAFAYAAAQIFIGAARRTGATSRLAMMTALQTPASYDTLVGPFRFTATGDPLDPNLYFYSVADGKFKFIAPSHATPFVL